MLSQFTQTELAVSDFSVTIEASIMGLAVTVVALVSSYVGRKEIIHFFSKFMPFR
jgi:putative Mn2+ efflux pump MntP